MAALQLARGGGHPQRAAAVRASLLGAPGSVCGRGGAAVAKSSNLCNCGAERSHSSFRSAVDILLAVACSGAPASLLVTLNVPVAAGPRHSLLVLVLVLLVLLLQALVDGRVLCVHGGLSPDIRTLDQVSSWGAGGGERAKTVGGPYASVFGWKAHQPQTPVCFRPVRLAHGHQVSRPFLLRRLLPASDPKWKFNRPPQPGVLHTTHELQTGPVHVLPHQVRVIDRVCEIPHEGPFCDLMWSDPEDIDTWAVSPRGAGWLFGRKVAAEFNNINGEQQAAGVWCACRAKRVVCLPPIPCLLVAVCHHGRRPGGGAAS